MSSEQPEDLDSTLIRRGRDAVTFPEMVEFAETIERRPLVQLLFELPALADLSETKFLVAANVLHRRFRSEEPVDQLQLRALGDEIAQEVQDPGVAARIRSLFDLDHG